VKPNKQLAARLVNELDPWQRAKELIDDYRLLLLADCEDARLESKCDELYRSFIKALQECAAAELHHMDVVEQARNKKPTKK
jgi:hypothetical protein